MTVLWGCRQLFHFSWIENLAYFSLSNHANFAASRMACIAHVVTGVCCGEHMRCPCVYCLCLACRVSFSARAPVQSLTHNQSAKDIDTHFKSQIYVDDPAHREQVLILPNALSRPERTTEIKFPSWVGFEPITYWMTVQHVTTELSPLWKGRVRIGNTYSVSH